MKNICFPFCNASPKKKTELSPVREESLLTHHNQPSLTNMSHWEIFVLISNSRLLMIIPMPMGPLKPMLTRLMRPINQRVGEADMPRLPGLIRPMRPMRLKPARLMMPTRLMKLTSQKANDAKMRPMAVMRQKTKMRPKAKLCPKANKGKLFL